VIKTVIFDLGRVLIPFDFMRGYLRMQAICGLEPAEIRARLSRDELVRRFETGLVENRAFVAEVASRLGAQLDYEGFCDIWSSIFLPETLIPEGVVAGIRRHHRTVLLSNTNDIHFTMLDARFPILSHFDARILSYEVKAMKPDPAIYQAAIDAAGCAAEECFFTDDIAAYVDGAKAMGIDAVQFESGEQAMRELAARGVRWD
jgi:putative hydrolase of the HAD superfamily